jgi:hypothetical protein
VSDAVITIGDTGSFDVGDEVIAGPDGERVITAIDREKGTITIGHILKRFFSEDIVQEVVFGVSRNADPVRLAGCRLEAAEGHLESVSAIGGATVAVITTVAALEWLRQRKAQVAAAEGSDEAYRSLLSDFIVWLTALFARMRNAQA